MYCLYSNVCLYVQILDLFIVQEAPLKKLVSN
jgi:hypothetical protein